MIDYVDVVKRVCKMLGLSFSLSNTGKNNKIYPMISSEYGDILIRNKNDYNYIMDISNEHYCGFDSSEICKKIIEESLNKDWCWDELIEIDESDIKNYKIEGKLVERYFEFPNTIEKLIMYLDLRGYYNES